MRVDRQKVYLAGYRTLREQSREFVVRHPQSVKAESVKVFWLDPDGSHVSVPVTR